MYFVVCSNIYDDVTNLKFADSWKTQTSKYLKKEIQFFPVVKNSLITPESCRDRYFKSGFKVIGYFILLEVGCLVTTVVNFLYKWARQVFLSYCKVKSDGFIFSEYFFNWLFNFIIVMWLYNFSKKDTKIIAIKLLSEDKKRNVLISI